MMARGGGGGGGTQNLVPTGGVPLKPPNPYLSLRVILAEKGTPLLRVFSQENCVCVYFSDEKGRKYLVSTAKLQKCGGMFKVFPAQKPYPMFKDFSQKKRTY